MRRQLTSIAYTFTFTLLVACAVQAPSAPAPVPAPQIPPPLPDDPRAAFSIIATDYRVGIHDCDDMAQEWRDYVLARQLHPPEELWLVIGRERGGIGRHCWLEWTPEMPCRRISGPLVAYDGVRLYVVYDPSTGRWQHLRTEEGDRYDVTERHEAATWCYTTDGGYEGRGDRYYLGRWWRGR